MEVISPLTVPELLFGVGLYLDQHTLTSCVRVSRTWHDILLPSLWYNPEFTSPKMKTTPVDVIKKARHVQRLAIDGYFASKLNKIDCSFPRLSVLVLKNRIPEKNFFAFRIFLKRHTSSLTDVSVQEISPEVMDILNECPNLKRVRLSGSPVEEATANKLTHWEFLNWIYLYRSLWFKMLLFSFAEAGSSVQDPYPFELIQPTLTAPSEGDVTDTDAAQIQELYLCHSHEADEECIWLIEQCPKLKRLTWNMQLQSSREQNHLSPIRRLADWIQARGSICQHLEDLALPWCFFENEDWARLLLSIYRLLCLDLSASSFNLESWYILQAHPRHLATLRGLDLSSCKHLPGRAIQAMMCEMPNLEIFNAGGTLSSLDLAEDARPWACLGLKVLSLVFMVVPEGLDREFLSQTENSPRKRYQMMKPTFGKVLKPSSERKGEIFSRVAGLRSLEELRGFSLLNLNEIQQELTIPGQLDQWPESLRRLRKLGPGVQGVERKERQWFLEQWPQMEIVLRLFNQPLESRWNMTHRWRFIFDSIKRTRGF